MAYVKNPLNKDDQGAQSAGVIGTDGSQISGDSSKPVSNWTNLNDYVLGNQGSGSQIADKMLEQGNKDVGAAEVAGADFAKNSTSQVDSATKKDSAGFENLFSSGDVSNVSQDQKNDYSNWKATPNYGGPADATGLQGYGELNKATDTAKKQAAKSYTQDSQYGLAQESLGKGNQNYTGGMSMLDTVLARQAGGGQKIDDFNKANSQENIQGKTQNVVTGANEYIGGAEGRGAANVAKVTSALQGRVGGLNDSLSQREAGVMGNQQTRYLEDQTRADYATNEELAALDNLINGFGAQVDDPTRQDLLNKSGKSKVLLKDYLRTPTDTAPIVPGQLQIDPNVSAEGYVFTPGGPQRKKGDMGGYQQPGTLQI